MHRFLQIKWNYAAKLNKKSILYILRMFINLYTYYLDIILIPEFTHTHTQFKFFIDRIELCMKYIHRY